MRRRRTKAQVFQLEDQILEVLSEDHPQSIRHVFYRMTDPRLPEPVDKTEKGYQQVQKRITEMRRSGKTRYDWISDATRRGYFTETFRSAGNFLERHAAAYRGDLWADADSVVEVWCESRSIAGVIQNLCTELAVDLFPCGGFSSISFVHETAMQLPTACRTKDGMKPVNVIYIGDYDPAGVLIDVSLERELRLHLEGTGISLKFHRLAITEEQIRKHDLPTKPRKPKDRRALHIQETVEAEAMPAKTLRELLRNAVESYLPQDALEKTKVAEESERNALNLIQTCLAEKGTDHVVDLLERADEDYGEDFEYVW